MEKWDLLTIILRENYLEEILDAIYKNTDKAKSMTEIIKESMIIWKTNNPKTKKNELVEQIIDSI